MTLLQFLVLTLVAGAPRRRATYFPELERLLASRWHIEADARGWQGPSLYDTSYKYADDE